MLDRFEAVCFQPEFPSTQDDEAARKRYLDHLRFGGTTIFLFRFFCGYGRWLWNHMMMRRNTKLMNMLVVVMVMVIMPALLKQRYRVIGDPELLFNVFFQNCLQGGKINLRKALSKGLIFLPLGSLFCWIMLVYWKKSWHIFHVKPPSRPCKMGPKWGPHNSTYNGL